MSEPAPSVPRILEGKTGVILGVANKRSLAWGCARSLADAGMKLAFTYANERLKAAVDKLAEECPGSITLPCDVTQPDEVKAAFETIGNEFGGLDAMVHAIAFARREELQGSFFDTSKEGYMLAHEVSAYSLTAVTRAALLSYLGADRVVPNYNVMGIAKAALEASVRYLAADVGPRSIRVNAISAGPIRTLSASGVKDFGTMLDRIAEKAPLRRNVTAEEVGDTCLFLVGPHSRGITGTTIFVDAGYHVMGL